MTSVDACWGLLFRHLSQVLSLKRNISKTNKEVLSVTVLRVYFVYIGAPSCRENSTSRDKGICCLPLAVLVVTRVGSECDDTRMSRVYLKTTDRLNTTGGTRA